MSTLTSFFICRYKKASARVHIFQGTPRPGSLTPSELSEDEDEGMPLVGGYFRETNL